jgi:ABC-type branched-subunit amino acid transport system substrate-binding protein
VRILKLVAAASVVAIVAVGCGGSVNRTAARKAPSETQSQVGTGETQPTEQGAQPAAGADTATTAPAADAAGAAPANQGAAAAGLPATAAPQSRSSAAKAPAAGQPAAAKAPGGGGAKAPDAPAGGKAAGPGAAPAPGAPTPGTPGVVTDVGISDTSIKVGMPFGLGGALGPFFKDLEKPAIAVLREANDAGGINGRKFQWTLEDTRWDVNTGTSAIKKLVEQDKVAYLVGWEHYTCNATGPYVDQVKVPMFGCEGAADDQYRHPYLFTSTCSSFRTWSHVAGKYITEHMGKSVYVVTHNTPGNTAGLKEFQYAVEQGGGKVIGVSQVPFDNADYTPQVLDMRQKNPDVVYNWVHPDQTVKLYLALQRQNYFPKILNGNESLPQGVWRGIGDRAKGALMLSCNALVKHATGFVQTTTRYYPQTSSTLFGWSMYGYGGAKGLVEGLRRSGRDMSRDAVRAALATGQPVDMGGTVPGAGLTYKPGNPPPNHFGTWLYSWDGNDYVDESKDFLMDPYPARTTNF